jgi:hypothetical protein
MRCQRRDRGYHGTICNDFGQRKSRRAELNLFVLDVEQTVIGDAMTAM